MDVSAVYLNLIHHQHTLLQFATGPKFQQQRVSNFSHYNHYLHTLLLTGTFALSQGVRTLYKGKLLLVLEHQTTDMEYKKLKIKKIKLEIIKLEKDGSINSNKGEGHGVNRI